MRDIVRNRDALLSFAYSLDYTLFVVNRKIMKKLRLWSLISAFWSSFRNSELKELQYPDRSV